ncbi:MAG TPA: LysR family transcriptional regulator [Rhizobiales bacterium]|nr:LysR family transcriptional regulator [Hyphomicrobiales bacterium]
MNITLRQLKTLEAVARHQNYTHAAKELHLSQPAVSMQIRQLEDMLGITAAEQIGKRIFITADGNKVLEAARDILQRLELMQGELEAGHGKVVGNLDIAVVTSAKHFLPRYLGAFVNAHPDVKPRLKVTNRASILEAISQNRHDLYILGQIPGSVKMQAVPFLDNILEVIAPPEHELCGVRNIPLERLAKERFLVREPGSGTRIAVDKVFVKHGLEITPFMELGSSGAIKNGVMANLGLAVLSRHSLEFELKTNSIEVLDVQNFPLRRRWFAAYPAGKSLSVAAASFMRFLTGGEQNRTPEN